MAPARRPGLRCRASLDPRGVLAVLAVRVRTCVCARAHTQARTDARALSGPFRAGVRATGGRYGADGKRRPVCTSTACLSLTPSAAPTLRLCLLRSCLPLCACVISAWRACARACLSLCECYLCVCVCVCVCGCVCRSVRVRVLHTHFQAHPFAHSFIHAYAHSCAHSGLACTHACLRRVRADECARVHELARSVSSPKSTVSEVSPVSPKGILTEVCANEYTGSARLRREAASQGRG